jgi:hypothetical protein
MPKNTSPAGKGGARRKVKSSGGLDQREEYTATESVARISVYIGRKMLGSIFESGGAHQAFDVNGNQIGVFPTRDAARAAFGLVRQ